MSASFDPKFIHFATMGSSLLTGLMVYWKLDEISGNAADSSGNSITGTSSNISYVVGKLNNCYQFNSTSSKVAFGDAVKPTTSMSVSAWVKTSETTKDTPILDCHIYGTNWEGYSLRINNDGPVGMFLGTNTATMFDSSANPIFPTLLTNNVWHHVVMTWNGTTIYCYVDNTKNAGSAYSSTIVYDASNVLNMGYDAANSIWANGYIDEVGVWNRALTDVEVTTLYNSGTGKSYNFS
jgi:hypothetical protein